ncbi:MAG: ribosome-associated translation inhibitor RaiA [Candidatus Hydrogenedentota bacterium]
MQLDISGRHMEITDALRSHVKTRLEKLKGHFDKVIDADVVLSVEKHRHVAEVTLHANGIRIHGEESSADMYSSVDAVVAKLEKQIRKYKDRVKRHNSRKAGERIVPETGLIEPDQDLEEESPDNELKIQNKTILRERLPMKPMDIVEASLQLELAEEPFIVFSNAETQQVNVMYARSDGTYGLIEPQF